MDAADHPESQAETFKAELGRGLPNLLWPLRLRPLSVLLASSALGLVTIIPVLGPVLAFALAAAIFHTGFRALEHTGRQGLADSEPLTLLPDGETVVRSVVFLIALMGWGALSLIIWTFGGLLGSLAAAILLAGVLPALIIGIGREHALVAGLLDSLNPAGILEIIRITGWAYAIAAGLPLVLFTATGVALYGLEGILALELRLAGAFFLAGYATLIGFRSAACLAARFPDDLRYTEERPRPVAPAPPREEREPTTDERISALIKAEQYEEAAGVLRSEVSSRPTDLKLWERYYRLLDHIGQEAPLLAASRGFLSVLLHAGEERRAMEVIQAALNRNPAFQPAKPEQVFHLARVARREGRPRLALRVMNGFAKRCPEHPDTPMILLFSARIMGEDFRKQDQAEKLLDSLLRSYPDHPLTGEARRLRQELSRAS